MLLQEQPVEVLLLEMALVSWSSAIDEHDEHQDLRGLGCQSVIPTSMKEWSCMAQVWPCLYEPEPFFFLTPVKWHLPKPFIAQVRVVTTSLKARQVALGQVKPNTIGRQWPGVAYDVFNGVGTSSLVACSTALGQQHVTALLCHCAL
jgi:hypothetical protein